MKKYIIKNWFGLSTVCILIIAAFLRFYDYNRRFGLGYDQAHDAIIGLYALKHGLIPLVGPFSSAGPFQTGGEWYWFIMTGYKFLPFFDISPWILLTFLYVAFVYLIIKVGEKLVNREYGLIAGVFSTVSTAQIAQSTNLTNQGPEAIIALVAVWFCLLYINKKKNIYIFFAGLFVGLGISIHLQAVALTSLMFLAFLFAGVWKVRPISACVLGFLIPFIPIFLFDIQNDFVNTKNMLQYFLYDQYKIPFEVLGRRWLSYIFIFWPQAWSHIIGGERIIGFLIMGIFGLIFAYQVLKQKIGRSILFLITSFLVMLVILRYVRTPLYDSYLVFLHPHVLLITSWIVYYLLKIRKAVGIVLILIIIGFSINKDIQEIKYPDGIGTHILKLWREELSYHYPHEKFTIYDLSYKYRDKSVPLSFFMYYDEKVDDEGKKIGLAVQTPKVIIARKTIVGEEGGYQIFDLNSSSSAALERAGWINVNPSYIYNSTQNWRKLSGK